MPVKSSQSLIARLWYGTTRKSDAERYLQYLHDTGVKECVGTPGNRGVYVLRRVQCEEAEFLFVSLWESFDAIRKFSGPEPEKAVYFPKDKEFLLKLEANVHHYDVVIAEEIVV